ncbi:hypothetical protein LG634_02360 [Streptomyces bambusae]|uniref:hypothetical protein n=1 Tax=Streptomyces bambusae TaxID=1550616 RepID=UPI001CFF08CB|nr:hypothetical protein [Streptomyces bambusae]MCB5163687.1 hypothetical protein [Streptomyces bambusae]
MQAERKQEAGSGAADGEHKEKRIDLSVAQVAGSSLATVAAAVLASQLGVYGTILGAGVVSVVATAGGPVIQHFFRRTGEQLREVRPGARQVPADPPAEERNRLPHAAAPARALPAHDRHDRTMLLRAPGATPGGADPAYGPPAYGDPAPGDGQFGSASTHGTRLRGWKRTALAAAVVFGISMGGITAYESLSGSALGGTGSSTLRTAFTGGSDGGSGSGTKDAPATPSPDGRDGRHPDRGGSDPVTPSPDPKPTPTPMPTPTPTPTPTPKPTPAPTPSGSGSDRPDPTGSPATGAGPDSGSGAGAGQGTEG